VASFHTRFSLFRAERFRAVKAFISTLELARGVRIVGFSFRHIETALRHETDEISILDRDKNRKNNDTHDPMTDDIAELAVRVAPSKSTRA